MLVLLLQDLTLPHNITATTSMAEAIAGARYAIHALPVQHSRAFLTAIKVFVCSHHFHTCQSVRVAIMHMPRLLMLLCCALEHQTAFSSISWLAPQQGDMPS